MTGGAGFIGSHVVDALLRDGYEVTVIDDLSSGDAERVAPEAELRELDIVDLDRLCGAASRRSSRARSSISPRRRASSPPSRTPDRDCEVNVQGTLNVVEAAGRIGAPVVFTSTGGALYGDDAPMPTPEDRIPAPLSPYGASKWAAEAYVKTWSLSSGIPHAVCRLGNVYGPRQNPHGEAGVVAIFSEPPVHRQGAERSTGTASRRATTSTSATSSARCSPHPARLARTTSPQASRPM